MTGKPKFRVAADLVLEEGPFPGPPVVMFSLDRCFLRRHGERDELGLGNSCIRTLIPFTGSW